MPVPRNRPFEWSFALPRFRRYSPTWTHVQFPPPVAAYSLRIRSLRHTNYFRLSTQTNELSPLTIIWLNTCSFSAFKERPGGRVRPLETPSYNKSFFIDACERGLTTSTSRICIF